MPKPGYTITESDAAPLAAARLSLATPFVVGELARGLEEAILVRSMNDVVSKVGPRRSDTAAMHDWLDVYFRERGSAAFITPLFGPDAAPAEKVLVDGAAATALTVTALEKGTWGNGEEGLAVDIDVSGTDFNVKIYLNEVLVEESGLVATGADAAAWAEASSSYVSITDGPGGDPVATAGAQNLTGGDDDFENITQTEIDAAVDKFNADLGPGCLVFPGRTSTAVHLAAATAAAARNRLVRADLPPTEVVATLTAHAETLMASENADRIDMLAPRLNAPGLTPSSARTVPASALRCAAESRNDEAGISPNQPAAGEWAIARYCTDASISWSDEDLATLNDAGVNVVRTVDGQLKVYGMRTAVDPETNPAGVSVGAARLRMGVREIARFRAEQATFIELDAGDVALGNLRGQISGDVLSRYAGSLWAVNAEGDKLEVTAEVVAGEAPGTYQLDVLVRFRPVGAAETVHVTISRAVSAS